MFLLWRRVLLFAVLDFFCSPRQCCAVVTTLQSTLVASLKNAAIKKHRLVKPLQRNACPVPAGTATDRFFFLIDVFVRVVDEAGYLLAFCRMLNITYCTVVYDTFRKPFFLPMFFLDVFSGVYCIV